MAIKPSKEYISGESGEGNKLDEMWNQYNWGLTIEQQKFIRENMKKIPNLEKFAQEVYGKPVSKRSTEFGNFKRFRIKVRNGNTSIFNLYEEDIEFVKNNGPSMSVVEMAKTLFPKYQEDPKFDGLKKSLERIRQAVAIVCKINGIESPTQGGADDHESFVTSDYEPPSSFTSLVGKINKIDPTAKLDASSYTPFQKKCLVSLKTNMNTRRFIMTANAIKRLESRELFESEYIKATWRRPELDADDVNGYISLAQEYVLEVELDEQRRAINDKIENLDDTPGNNQLYLSFTKHSKEKSDELHKCRERIKDLAVKLSGSRKDKIDKETSNESFSKFISAFQEERWRKEAEIVSRARNEEVKQEIYRVKTFEDLVAEIFGISEEEMFQF